jgi:hypothetical protein
LLGRLEGPPCFFVVPNGGGSGNRSCRKPGRVGSNRLSIARRRVIGRWYVWRRAVVGADHVILVAYVPRKRLLVPVLRLFHLILLFWSELIFCILVGLEFIVLLGFGLVIFALAVFELIRFNDLNLILEVVGIKVKIMIV